MKVSTKTRYALCVMLDFAMRSPAERIQLKDVAARQGISKAYVEQIMRDLNHAGFFESSRGFGGGYRLARPTTDYSLAEIVEAVDGQTILDAAASDKPDSADPQTAAIAQDFWAELDQKVGSYLRGLSLQDLIDSKAGGSWSGFTI
ncbi:MAG: Rrf2 family transcriptional regulator [Coriobacteriales bacterium]|jgi:Rrf2 family protein|nr:Rrf2 family transcriptional regulator [Coriobacteriales bacterium]